MNTQAALKVDHLTKDFGHGRGIFDVSFEVYPGEVFGFLGPNGAGKTTTIRHIMGFTKPGRGSVTVQGLDATTAYSQVMKHVGYLPGEVALPDIVTGWEFIKTAQQMRHVKDDGYLKKLIEIFDLDLSMNTKRMSLGNKRKLAVIAAFLADPEILILDEPTSGLDPAMQETFINFMVSEKRRGKTILLSSHIFPEVEATCDRIAIIKDGRIVSQVDANKLQNKDKKTFELFFANQEALKQAGNELGGTIEHDHLDVTVSNGKLTQFFGSQLKGRQVTRLNEVKFDLEKYFLDFYRTDKVFKTI